MSKNSTALLSINITEFIHCRLQILKVTSEVEVFFMQNSTEAVLMSGTETVVAAYI